MQEFHGEDINRVDIIGILSGAVFTITHMKSQTSDRGNGRDAIRRLRNRLRNLGIELHVANITPASYAFWRKMYYEHLVEVDWDIEENIGLSAITLEGNFNSITWGDILTKRGYGAKL